jgi:SacI restriction endonuclease
MAHQIAAVDATRLLDEVFTLAEDDHREGKPINLPNEAVTAIERLFRSDTQAYREALIGCAVARTLNPKIDIRHPATDTDINSFSGRSLADQVITPFMRERAVPISASPYLSSLRGGARFIPGGEPRIQRDQYGFDALVEAVEFLRDLDEVAAKNFLRQLLHYFIILREASNIVLTRIGEPKLEQLTRLVDGLLELKSGGRIPSFLTTAMYQTLSDCHSLGWDVEYQGINVADKASGAVGDITVKKGEKIVIGIEVTERPISGSRVKGTFEQKISPANLREYLFVTTARPEDGALALARSYAGVGHEINFVNLREWLLYNLATIGADCRAIFQDKMIDLLRTKGTPADLRHGWNKKMDIALGVTS